ncbi:MAG TPA: hypothetical protein VKA43_10650 [Gammaproteobacteria bacterium]|nr:hypothetical protein [Gammaproteobacteria bacterium]
MNDERHGLFTELTPPPGGAERFAKRLDETAQSADAPRRRGFAFAAAACAAAALVLAVMLLREPGDSASPPVAAATEIYDAPEFDRLLGRPSQPAEFTVTLGERTASVVEVETTNEKVRIYEIN